MALRHSHTRPVRSIHSVLLQGTIALLLLVLGSVAWLSFDGSQHEAEELFDARLATSARVLEALIAKQVATATINTPIVIELPRPLESVPDRIEATPLGHYYETKIAFQVWRNDGVLLVRSGSAPDVPFAPMAAGYSTRQRDSHGWRVFVLHSSDVWIQVAERDDARNELAARLALVAVLPLAIGGPLLLLLLSLLIRYGVAPLKQLSRRLQTRRPDSLEPMVLQREPAEMVPLMLALNALLARMQEALARERRFTAHAAHELRTPLAAMQVHAQNAAGAPNDAERRTSLDRMVAALRRTVHLSEQMLAYSRASAPATAPLSQEIALGQVVIEVMAEIEPRFHARSMPLTLSGGEACRGIRIRGDRHKIASVVSNLLENALNYAPAGSAVNVNLSSTSTTVTLSVTDAGPGIPVELRERVFEGYFRIPGGGASGSGLGLAIVKEIAAQHAANIEIGDGANGIGTRVSVSFPIAQAVRESDDRAAVIS